MKLADVYPKYSSTIVKAEGCYIWDAEDRKILDFYSGHGVISIGHQHPRFVYRLKRQLDKLAYYSNIVELKEQLELAEKLGEQSGYHDGQLFLVNSGAEAVENALKIASFSNGRKRIIALRSAFHGRTDLAVQCSDDPKLRAPINQGLDIIWVDINDEEALHKHINHEVCAVIIEGIQGIAGVHIPSKSFLQLARSLTEKYGAYLILDEIQSGYGRSGKFFAHQYAEIQADMVTIAKGMGNGFPIAGVIIRQDIPLRKGMLGTTFGGSPLACAAGIAVLDTLKEENLIDKAAENGAWLMERLADLPQIRSVRGQGLMIAADFNFPTASLRSSLFYNYNVMVGSSSSEHTIRLLPPLTVSQAECQILLESLEQALLEANAEGIK